MHQSSKYLCPSSRGSPDSSKTPPTCKVWMILSHVLAIEREQKFPKIVLIDNLVLNTSKSLIITKHQFFGIVITCFKIIQTLQVEGVLELSGDPLEDEHRYFTNSQKKVSKS